MRTRGLFAVSLLLLSGCGAFAPPKAWQRGHLAQSSMAWDPDPVAAAARDHTYVSKEAASGGASSGGGGCGCR